MIQTYFFINVNDLLLSAVIDVLHASDLLPYRVHDHFGHESSKHDVQIFAMRPWPNVATGACVARTITGIGKHGPYRFIFVYF